MEREYTTKEKLANWFYYNKLWVAVGIIILWVVGSMLWNILGIGQVEPDYRFAYVGRLRLPEDCVSALEAGLASLGTDLNGDGAVTVSLTQHIYTSDSNTENMMYSYSADVTILADITEGESCFFLLEDPAAFQLDYQVLAEPDGSMPEEDDYEALDKVYLWGECPVLSSLELGSYTDQYLDQTETGECQELLENLYLGRRFFYDPAQEEYPEGNDALWNAMTEGAGK